MTGKLTNVYRRGMASTWDIRKLCLLVVAGIAIYWLLLPRTKEEVKQQDTGKQEKAKSTNIVAENLQGSPPMEIASLQSKARDSAHKEETKNLRAQIQDYESELEVARSRIRELELTAREAHGQVTKETDSQEKQLSSFDGHRLVHLDLKGAAPKIEYLLKIVPLVKSFGATGFLIEYEDTFPFTGNLSILRGKSYYKAKELQQFLDLLKEENMIFIPLIQTFGHLEFMLKHKRFAYLRETPQMTNSLCPLHPDSQRVVKDVIKQMLDFHKGLKWIHLGGDEVWNLKTCKKCVGDKKSAAELFMHHMLPLFNYVNKISIGQVKPIIWDDMLRHWSVGDLKQVSKVAEVMVWAYVPNLKTYHKFPEDLWERYMEAFQSIWFASSFKGAEKPYTNFVPLHHHLMNHLSWLKIYNGLQRKSAVQGIALTGWSRYDHYGPLCELLPASIPSLSICIAVLGNGEFSDKLHKEVSKRLGFQAPFQVEIPSFIKYIPEEGTFPGHDVYTLAGNVERALNWYNLAEHRAQSWTRPFQLNAKHLSFHHLNVSIHATEVCMNSLTEIKDMAQTVLTTYFDKNTVDEWIADKILYGIEKAKTLRTKMMSVAKLHKFL